MTSSRTQKKYKSRSLVLLAPEKTKVKLASDFTEVRLRTTHEKSFHNKAKEQKEIHVHDYYDFWMK